MGATNIGALRDSRLPLNVDVDILNKYSRPFDHIEHIMVAIDASSRLLPEGKLLDTHAVSHGSSRFNSLASQTTSVANFCPLSTILTMPMDSGPHGASYCSLNENTLPHSRLCHKARSLDANSTSQLFAGLGNLNSVTGSVNSKPLWALEHIEDTKPRVRTLHSPLPALSYGALGPKPPRS
ncbi:hypothetical protein JAAARDRAFT_200502 [Jaapia argillacea MUCL 33604]|uniref:Uncharacterized protein n=1 Tax=Jaapia argillacea MUCL 33604 TaxID=933084 RepID=A0A067P7Q3_9AGAM|nr:hypothetical protein JAAARDRAFT_200502 [Jaapia argillacea MUCL 33604]